MSGSIFSEGLVPITGPLYKVCPNRNLITKMAVFINLISIVTKFLIPKINISITLKVPVRKFSATNFKISHFSKLVTFKKLKVSQ